MVLWLAPSGRKVSWRTPLPHLKLKLQKEAHPPAAARHPSGRQPEQPQIPQRALLRAALQTPLLRAQRPHGLRGLRAHGGRSCSSTRYTAKTAAQWTGARAPLPSGAAAFLRAILRRLCVSVGSKTHTHI